MAISLPATPQLVGASPYPNRASYFTLAWNKAKDASQYILKVANDQAITDVFETATTSDTSKLLTDLYVGQRYYWRVQATNNAGSSPWSNVSTFSTLAGPTNLSLQRTAANEITLTWTVSTASVDGYVVERKSSTDSSFAVIDSLTGNVSTVIDNTVQNGKSYTYRVKAFAQGIESDYTSEATLSVTGIVSKGGTPTEYSISQNYPNPFNPSAKIKFALTKTALTSIVVYDILGREIRTLVNKELGSGYYEVNFDASNLSSGIYFYRIQSGAFTQTKKMILMK